MSLTKENIIELLRSKKKFLQQEFGVKSILLFGSYAREEATEDSDIDFFVEMPADFFKRCELIEFLENLYNRKVDVIRKHPNIRNRFLEEIAKEAIYV